MSLLRALRVYIGLGPDDEVEGEYLGDLSEPRTVIDLTGDEAVVERSPSRSGNGTTEQRRTRPTGPETGAYTDSPQADTADTASPRRRSRPAPSRTDGVTPGAPRNTTTGNGRGPDDPPSDGVRVRELPPEEKTSPEGEAMVHSLDRVRAKPKTIVPETFSDAKTMADDFKLGVPIVLNLQGVDRELGRRLIDFASGLCYGLDGAMEKIASQVFLVTPNGVEVRDEDREKIANGGYTRK